MHEEAANMAFYFFQILSYFELGQKKNLNNNKNKETKIIK